MPNSGQPDVRYGDKGESVSQAQRALRRTPNTTLEVDGIFGSRTEEATKEFQKAKALTISGVVDQQTWNAATCLEFMVGLQYTVAD
jgi:peptidoglycan hydrolase-like protein with peptidoglycan-binding domain